MSFTLVEAKNAFAKATEPLDLVLLAMAIREMMGHEYSISEELAIETGLPLSQVEEILTAHSGEEMWEEE